MKKFIFAIAATTLFGTPLAYSEGSPNQTVEGANRFLNTLASGKIGFEIKLDDSNNYWSAKYYQYGFKTEDEDYYVAWGNNKEGVKYRVSPITLSGVTGSGCKTMFDWPAEQVPGERLMIYIEGEWKVYNDKYFKLLDLGGIYTKDAGVPHMQSELTIDWSRVVAVTASSTSVTLKGPGTAFILPTADLAKRVQYAMEFLRNACDPTAGTGF